MSPWHATAAQRDRLSGLPDPLLDPWAQDYAAWRAWSLRWACAAVAMLYAFGLAAGVAFSTVKFGLKTPTPAEWWLEAGLSWYARSLAAVFCLMLVASTWYWYRLGWSCSLVRSGWVLTFLGLLPIFLIPYPWVFEQHGVQALVLGSSVVRSLVSSFFPTLFALFPALIRASLVLKRLLPESALPGMLIVLASPLQSLIFLLLVCILLQIFPHRDLILGILFLAAAPLVWLTRAKTLVRSGDPGEARRALRFVSRSSSAVTLIGASLVLLELLRDVDLNSLLGQVVDFRWVLYFMAGVLAQRATLSVILVDGMLSMMFHALPADEAGVRDGSDEDLERKLRSIGRALTAVAPTSKRLDTGVVGES